MAKRTRYGSAIVLKCHAILHLLFRIIDTSDGHNPRLCEKFEFCENLLFSKPYLRT